MHVPMRESRIYCFKPRIDAAFAYMDFLSTPDKANNNGPFGVAIHARNQKLRLRVGEPWPVFSSLHEIRSLSQVPSALRFVKDHNMFGGRAGVDQCLVAKVVNVLDERFDALANFALPYSNAKILLTCDLITGQRLTEHCDERAVPRKKHSVCRLVCVPASSCNIQPNEGFASSWNTGNKANEFTPLSSCLIDEFFDAR